MNIYVMERQLLIDEIKKGFVLGNKFFERDVLAPQTEKLNIQGYEFTGYQARIDDMKSYFDENMKLLKDENLDSLRQPDLYQSPRRQSDPLYQRIKSEKRDGSRRLCDRRRNRKQHFVPWCQGSQGSKSKELHSDAGYCD